jgi:hypothetical protein
MLNSQYSRGIIGIVQVGGVQNICSSSGGVQENEKIGWNSELVEKLVWVTVISLCKIFITSSAFDAPIMPKLAILGP